MLDKIILRNGDIVRWERHSWRYEQCKEGKVTHIYCSTRDGGHAASANPWCKCWKGPIPDITGAELESLWGEKNYVTPHELDEFAMTRKHGGKC